MPRLLRRLFSRVINPPRPRRTVRRAADLKARLLVHALEGRVVPATFTVLNTNDAGAGSLRQAILDANADTVADTILFNTIPANGTDFTTARTITLTTGSLTIANPLTITGPGATLLTVSGN